MSTQIARSSDDTILLAQTRFAQWRSSHSPARRPVPTELWEVAVRAAKQHGIYAVSQALRLHYARLKHRVENGRHRKDSQQSTQARQSFVEFIGAAPLVGPSMPGHQVEVVRQDGCRLLIRTSGALDAASVVAAFGGAPCCK
jgi:hypothetical protein